MKTNIIFLGARSVTFELVNDSCYYTEELYDLYVNGEKTLEKQNLNVISLYDLEPFKEYKVDFVFKNETYTTTFTTEAEFVTLNVKKFGAKGDGVTDDTLFIQACINACPKNGRVYIPAGKYSVCPLFLKSNITIELAKGAHLLH